MTYYFEGFSSPNSTYVPDVVFDEIAPQLSEAELRALLYIIRRTFGFKKNADNISLRQMTHGIRTIDGKVLDNGTGLSKSANARGIKGLVEKGIILSIRNRSKTKGDEATTYALHFKDTPVSSKETGGVPPREHGGVLLENTQHTVKQDTVRQQTDATSSNIRKAQPVETKNGSDVLVIHERPKRRTSQEFESINDVMQRNTVAIEDISLVSEEAHDAVAAYITEFAQEFSDRAPVKSSITRALNLFSRSRLSLPVFLRRLFEARSLTRESVSMSHPKVSRPQKRMAYFFACLEDTLHFRTDEQKTRRSMSPDQSPVAMSRSIASA